MVSNQCNLQFGLYIIRIKEEDPYGGEFLIKWQNRLKFGDVNIEFLIDPDQGYREMVICYKVIYLNIFNILVLDLNKIEKQKINQREKQFIIYRHESFQLWESDIFSILLKKS